MSNKEHYNLDYGRLEILNNLYYIYNEDEDFPIVLTPKTMLKLVRAIGKMQTLGKEIKKCLEKEKPVEIAPLNGEDIDVRKTHYGLSIALKKFSIVRLLVISRGTEVALTVGEYHISHKNPHKLTRVHGELQINLTENYPQLLMFAYYD